MTGIFEYFIFLTYGLLAVAVAAAIIFPLLYTVRNFSKSKGSLIGVLVLIAIFVACVAVSSGEVYEKFGITSGVSKQVGGGLIMLYVMTGLAVLTAIYNEVSKLFK